MKVLQVLPALNEGGVERGTLEIARALVEAGHQSEVLSAGGHMVRILQREGSVHHQWDLGRKSLATLLQTRKLRRWLVEQDYDLVHLRSRMPAWAVWRAWRRMDKQTRPRLVSTVHGLHSVSRYSRIVTCGERVIVVSESVRDYVLKNYKRTDPNKLRLVYRGIDPRAFPRDYRPAEGWLAKWYHDYPQLIDHAVITLAGRLTRLKGHRQFLEMIAQLRERELPVKGLIVGGEDPRRIAYAEELYQYTEKLGLGGDVVFTGHRKDIREVYAVSDVVMSLSSKPESFGRTVLEPLSMGVPVVGYDHGGVGEILHALYPDGAVPLGSVDQAAAKVTAALAHRGGEVRANDRFLLAAMQASTLQVYEELLASERQ